MSIKLGVIIGVTLLVKLAEVMSVKCVKCIVSCYCELSVEGCVVFVLYYCVGRVKCHCVKCVESVLHIQVPPKHNVQFHS